MLTGPVSLPFVVTDRAALTVPAPLSLSRMFAVVVSVEIAIAGSLGVSILEATVSVFSNRISLTTTTLNVPVAEPSGTLIVPPAKFV